MIRAISAIDDNRGIAASDHPPFNIPWDIPEDREYYKQKTLGATIIMGRGTYETFEHPLPNRRNIVVSSTLINVHDGFELNSNLHDFIATAEGDVWIIGGQKLYESTLLLCDELYITHIQGDYSCDRFFPAFDQHFRLEKSTDLQKQNGYTFQFSVYTKTGKP